MGQAASNRRRILNSLSRNNAPGDLPFLPWGLDALAEPPHPSYAPLFDLLRGCAVIKRRWTDRPDFFLPGVGVERTTQEWLRPDGTSMQVVRLSGRGGMLVCERRGIPGTTASESTSRFLKSAEDIERYLAWPYDQPAADPSPYLGLEREVGERGVVTLRMTDALGVVGEACEPEPFALLSVENRGLILSLLEVIAARIIRYARALLDGGARPIFILSGPEFATPPLLSPRHFDDYVIRFDRPLVDLIHSYGCRVIVHCHGRMDAVLERFADMGVDGLHPLEAPPMGDVTLGDARQRVGEKLCFVGTVQIGDMMSAAPEEIRRQVREIREQACPGMILTTSATPYESPMSQRLFENYVAACETANE